MENKDLRLIYFFQRGWWMHCSILTYVILSSATCILLWTRLIPPNSDWHQTALVSYLFFIFLICDDADRKFYHLSVLVVHILYEPLCWPKDSESAFYEALTSRGAAQSRARLRAYGLGYEKFATGGSLSKLTGGVI